MSYSQHDEEQYILEAVGDLENGVFLDIGAYDGRSLSNSLALVERGWSGVLVEPNHKAFEALLRLHGANSKLGLVNALVGVENGIVPFWGCDGGDMVSTTEQKNFTKWTGHASFGPQYYAAQVDVRKLIEEFPTLEDASVVSIDTEGTSVDLFLNWPIESCRPKVFIVEYDDQLEYVQNLAKLRSYRVAYQSVENLVLVSED